jgi:brefeldin A-inhibited guanine nucleotide-exchange protein
MEGYTNFPAEPFQKHIETFYPLAVELLSRDLGVEVRLALHALLRRIGEMRFGMPPWKGDTPSATPTSPRSAASVLPVGRRTSRGR